MTMLAQDRGEEALAEAAGEPDEVSRLWALAIVQHVLRSRAGSDETLQKLHSEDSAYQKRDGGLSCMKRSRQLRFLHSDPRWSAFLRKVGLDE
jgi:hypothetical protein